MTTDPGPLLPAAAALFGGYKTRTATITIWIDPGDASVLTLEALLRSLSHLHVMAGGYGLRFEVDHSGPPTPIKVTCTPLPPPDDL